MIERLRLWLSGASGGVYRDGMPAPTMTDNGSLEWNIPDGWMYLGVCPEPSTKWEEFKYHVGHGLAMQFPIWKCLVWSLVHMTYPADYVVDAIEGEA